MRVVLDIEANGLEAPTQIWLIVCKDIDTGELHIFRNLTTDQVEKERFISYVRKAELLVGHNLLGYDYPVINKLLDCSIADIVSHSCDTLVLSKLINYSRPGGHSVESYGVEFALDKIPYYDFSALTPEMEEYCIRDVEITYKIYLKYLRYLKEDCWKDSIELEQYYQYYIVNELHINGFSFNIAKGTKLLAKVEEELSILDAEILKEFPAKLRPIKEIHPKVTKHGTLSKSDFRWVKDGDLSDYNGGPFTRCEWVPFNPASHKQVIEVLSLAGWSPIAKTQTHIDTERELNQLKYRKQKDIEVDLRIKELYTKTSQLEKYGWKINEENLRTLPDSAPSPARALAKRILIESRRRTLTEWLGLVSPDTSRIHGRFYGIGAWTHRMAHQQPNTANIPTDAKLYGKEMRSLWQAPRNRLLVGVDAEGIQLRIFAHYIDDAEFTDALVKGKKDEKTDPHSLNQRILGSVCKSRAIAKRFIYALLLGAGLGKLAEILGCSREEAQDALDRLLARYQGFAYLKERIIPSDAQRGWFQGLDGRKVRIPGETVGQRKHLCMSGYLQNGEAIVVKRWVLKSRARILLLDPSAILVNVVHDEKIDECINDFKIALGIAQINAAAITEVGEELKLKCPLAGSYWNDDHKDYTIGTNWYQTH